MCRGCCEDAVLAVRCRELRRETLRRVYLFDDLGDEALGEVVERARETVVAGDDWICFGGDPADCFYLVVRGEVALLRHSADGDEVIVALVGAGELFGEDLVFLEEATHALSARALCPTELVRFDRRHFRRLLASEPSLPVKLLQTLHRRNTILLDEIERVTLQSAGDRLLAFLETQSAAVGGPVRIPKRVLASRLSIRPETLSRLLGRFKACERLREVDGCLELTADTDPCATCPSRFWGCPGPRAESPAAGDAAARAPAAAASPLPA